MNLNGLREDSFVLKILYATGMLQDPSLQQCYTTLPLMVVPNIYLTGELDEDGHAKGNAIDINVNDWNKYFATYTDHWLKDGYLVDPDEYGDYLQEFMFFHDEGKGNTQGAQAYFYGHHKVISDTEVHITMFHIMNINTKHSKNPKDFIIETWGITHNYKPYVPEEESEIRDNREVPKGALWIMSLNSCYGMAINKDTLNVYKDGIELIAKRNDMTVTAIHHDTVQLMVKILSAFHKFAYHEDKYLTLIRSAEPLSPREKRTRRSKPWLIRNAPRLIYLNRLPSQPKPNLGGTHVSPIPHRKKGFWRTLSALRFKNHPHYKVYKGNYVRPCFVGDKDKIIEGHRYTIVTKGTRLLGSGDKNDKDK